MSYTPGQNHRLSYAAAVALLVHGILLFWVTFNAVSDAAAARDMEVTLSHASADEAPEDADFIAQSNQLGSGDGDVSKEITTRYDSIFSDQQINDVKPIIIPEQRQSVEAIVSPRVITTTGEAIRNIRVIKPLSDAAEREDQGSDAEKNLAELSLEIASLEARLADKQQRFTKKPRVLILTSASTIAAEDANYVHQWRDRVEDIGNLHYPSEARDKGLYGDVRLLVKLKANGIVEETTIMSSSGSAILDRAAIESIRLASPFEPFPKALAEKYDRIDVIRTWQFRKDRLSAKAG